MPDFRYTGGDARYYPALALRAVPAGAEGGPTVAEFDVRPAPPAEGEQAPPVPAGARYAPTDGRWEPVPAAKKKTTPAPAPAAAAPAPAGDGQKEV